MAKKNQLNEMISLINRMEKPQSGWATLLNEGMDELDARGREEVPTDKFFDMVANVHGGWKTTIGYISKANLAIPQVKRLNPQTKRMKNYDDWDSFGQAMGEEKEIVGVIKFGCYTFNWRSPMSMNKHYNKNYVDVANPIRADYGLSPMERRKGYTSTADYGKGGISVYNGTNDALSTHSYSPQDLGGKDVSKKEITYYLIFSDGTMKPVDDINKLVPYFKQRSISGVSELRKLGKSDEEIKAYADKIAAIPFKYTNFEHSSIVFVITKVDGKPSCFFNQNLTSTIQDIPVDPTAFINIVKEKYKLEQQNMSDDLGEFDDDIPDEYPGVGE